MTVMEALLTGIFTGIVITLIGVWIGLS